MLVDYPADREELRQVARDFLARHCPPDLARACDEEGRFPRELFRRMGDLGWLGIPFGEDVGGSGGDPIDEAIVVEQIGRAMGPLASAFVISVLTCGKTVRDLGTDEQRRRWLPSLVTGETMMAFALTEPDAGSDAAAIRTRASRVEGGWSITGQKIFCTGASLADHLLVMARTDDGSPKQSISMFVVPTDSPGLTITPIPKLGLHPYPSCMLFFDGVVVGDDGLLGVPGGGWPHLVSSLNRERLAISAMCTGMATAALDAAVAYAGERKQFGVTITHFEAVRRHIADMAIAVESARALMLLAAGREAEGRSSTLAASMAKIRSSDAAVDTARLGMQVMGGYSYTMEYPMQRFLRDALIHPIAGGSNEIQRNIIAGELLAHPEDIAVDGGDVPAAMAALARRVLSAAGAAAAEEFQAVAVAADLDPLLAADAARATAIPTGWSVSGTATLLGPCDAPCALLAPLGDGTGAVLLRLEPAAARAAQRPRGDGVVALRFDGLTVKGGDALAELDSATLSTARDELGAGSIAVLVRIADTAQQQVAGVLRERGAGAADRWAGQSLKHRLADARSQRDVAWLEMHRAAGTGKPDVRALHTAVGLHEALTAATRSVQDSARMPSDGTADSTAAVAIATLDTLAGGPDRLKLRVAGYVLRGDATRRA